jgi:soluble lytic murein transglycosylase-like protein
MRVASRAVLAAALGFAPAAGADIYRYRGPSGIVVYTNAPSERFSSLFVRERPLPPAPRMFAALPNQGTLAPMPLPSVAPTGYDPLIRQIAAQYSVEYALVKAVIKAESDFNRNAISSKGAQGLMQLMPQTAALHGVRNVFLPRDNIEGGCRHLRMLLGRYGGNIPLAVAAYNAGTRRVEEAGGIPPIPETREYVARVLRYRLAYVREGGAVVEARR